MLVLDYQIVIYINRNFFAEIVLFFLQDLHIVNKPFVLSLFWANRLLNEDICQALNTFSIDSCPPTIIQARILLILVWFVFKEAGYVRVSTQGLLRVIATCVPWSIKLQSLCADCGLFQRLVLHFDGYSLLQMPDHDILLINCLFTTFYLLGHGFKLFRELLVDLPQLSVLNL